jgi:hypothetical protein
MVARKRFAVGTQVRDEGWRARQGEETVVSEDEGVACRGCRKEQLVSDPFGKIRELSDRREEADWAWRCEVLSLRAAGFSTRAIAQVAGVSHDTVWRIR